MVAADTRSPVDTHVDGGTHLTKLDWLLLALVLGVAIFFRFWQQGHIPPGMDFDEAFESMEARRLLIEPGYHPVFFLANNGVPPLKIYLTAAAFLIIGEQTLAIRYVSGVVGTLTVLALYVLVRKLFPRPVSDDAGRAWQTTSLSALGRRLLPLGASLLLAVLPWHTTFSRHGIEVILLPLWATLAILFLWQGLTTLKWRHFALSGFFWGSVYYTYQAAWLLPGVLVLFVVYKALQERGFLRRYAGRLLVLTWVALLALAPLANFALHHPDVFVHRSAQIGIFALGSGSETPLLSLARNTVKTAGLFLVGGDIAITDNIYKRPPLPLILALILLVGLGVALRRVKRAEYALLLIWFAWMLLPTIVTENAPSIRRAIGSTPPMVILMTLGTAWLCDTVTHRMPSRRAWRNLASAVTGLAVGGLLVYMMIWSYRYYFIEWANVKELFHYFDVGLVEIGKYAATTPTDTNLYYTPAGEGNVVHFPLRWQIRDRDLRTFDGNFGLVLAPPDPQRSLYLITTFLADSTSLAALQAIYPTGRPVYQVRNLYGVPHSLVFAVEPNTTPSVQLQNPRSANFQNQIELLGSNLSDAELRPGDLCTVTLVWRALAAPSQISHTVFVHLLGAPNPADGSVLWAGHDGPPLNNSYPTTRWRPGEVLFDRHAFMLPANLPPGSYQIEAGLYDPQQGGARLKILDAPGAGQADSLFVGAVMVR